jgi:hypothetical protein
MMTFRQFEARAASGGATIPTATGWSLAELGEAMGKQTLFTRQSQPTLRDRDEEEGRGYRNALDEIHTHGAGMPVSEQTIKELHR